MSKIIRLVVAKGKSSPANPKDPSSSWLKKWYEIEIKFPAEGATEEMLQENRLRGEMLIDGWLEEAPHIPKLDIAKINALPWKKRNKEPAKPGEFAWLFGPGSRDGTERGAEKLVNAIKKAGGKLVIGDCEYSLVKEDVFVQRKPVRK
jgi:hypothetical protein